MLVFIIQYSSPEIDMVDISWGFHHCRKHAIDGANKLYLKYIW